MNSKNKERIIPFRLRYIYPLSLKDSAMPVTIFGSQFFSGIGAELRDMRSFSCICSTQDIDLATQIIPAGDYSMTVNVIMGQVNIFVPKHIRTVVDGTVLFGAASIYDSEAGWKKFIQKFQRGLGHRKSGEPALAFHDTSGEVILRIHLNGFLGTVRIYRLEQETQLLQVGIVAVGV